MKVRWPVRTQLFYLVLSIAVPLIGLFLYIKSEESADDIKNASNSALNLAQITAASTEQFIQDSHTLLAQLARRALDHDIVPVECDAFLSDFQDLPHIYANFIVADAAGNLICSAVPILPGQVINYSDRQWFQNV